MTDKDMVARTVKQREDSHRRENTKIITGTLVYTHVVSGNRVGEQKTYYKRREVGRARVRPWQKERRHTRKKQIRNATHKGAACAPSPAHASETDPPPLQRPPPPPPPAGNGLEGTGTLSISGPRAAAAAVSARHNETTALLQRGKNTARYRQEKNKRGWKHLHSSNLEAFPVDH